MNVRLVFVPPGDGEAGCSLEFDLPSIPKGCQVILERVV